MSTKYPSRWSVDLDGHVKEMGTPSRKGVGLDDCRRKLLNLSKQQADEILGFYDACHPIALARRTNTKNFKGGSRDLFPAAR